MERIALTQEQKSELHTRRKAVESTIRGLKKELRGKPHTEASSGHQMDLRARRADATALYALLAASRGREHFPDAQTRLDAAVKLAATYKAFHAPKGKEPSTLAWVGLVVEAAKAPAVEQPAA